MPTQEDVRNWAEAYRIAWEQADSEAVAGLFSPEATYRDNIFEEAHQGHQGVID